MFDSSGIFDIFLFIYTRYPFLKLGIDKYQPGVDKITARTCVVKIQTLAMSTPGAIFMKGIKDIQINLKRF